MNKVLRMMVPGLLLIACRPGNAGTGDDFKLEEGFVLLFNGKDLTGWEHGYCPPGTRPNHGT